MAKTEAIIYISSHNIQLIQGTCDKKDMIKIEKFEQYPLMEGSLINGVITDDQEIRHHLDSIEQSGIKEVRLVIDSGQILTKNITVPILNKKELMKVTKDELSDIDASYDDLLYEYCVLRQSFEDDRKGGEILCCAMERKLLSSYVELFEGAEITLKSIDVSTNALHKLTQELTDLDHKTYIVSILDGNNISSYLFEDNHYTFSNRTRLFSDRGTSSFATEMISNISQLLQFSKSKQSKFLIETAYFCGLQEDETASIFENIQSNLNIEAREFPNSKLIYIQDKVKEKLFSLHEYVFPVGCLIRR